MAFIEYSATDSSKRSISDFRSQLDGGGLRPNLYEVRLDFPAGVAAAGTDLTTDGIFLCKAASLTCSECGID